MPVQFSIIVQPASFQEAKDVDVKEYFGEYLLSSYWYVKRVRHPFHQVSTERLSTSI